MAGFFADQGQRLRAVRLACGFRSQNKFAAQLELSKGHWNDFENNKRPLTLDVAQKIKRRWRLPLDFLIDGDLEALDLAPAGLVRKLEALAA